METAILTVSMGVMKPLLSKLTKLLGEQCAKLTGLDKQIKFLRDELSTMSDALEMLADQEELTQDIRGWRDNLRELAYDIEDFVDSFVARIDHVELKGYVGFVPKLMEMKVRHKMANEMEELKKRAEEISKRHKRYNFANMISKSNSSTSTVDPDPRLPALYEKKDKLVGIGGPNCPKKHIIDLLTLKVDGPSTKLLKVVSITGCGGIGKTTLAMQVYETIKSKFACAAFVSVSRCPNVRNILRDLAKRVRIIDNILDDDDEHQIIDKLREHLQNIRYFVVIDDVWDTKSWKFIKLALPNNDLGSRIITTTRNATIASFICSQNGNVYHVKPLSFADSKRLLYQRAFGSANLSCTHLGRAPNDILRKCDGLPLAVITISSILANQHAKGEWDRVFKDIGSALAKNPGAGDMTTILSRSYLDIPHRLKTCLLYLSVFPEDYEIKKQCVINRWIAEGFIPEKEGQTQYETGECFFNDLVNRSLIQPVVHYGQTRACRVHDIILDYIKSKAAEENFVTSLDAAEHGYTSEYKVRRLCIDNRNEENFTLCASMILSHVRSLTIHGRPIEISLLAFTALRVLDLGNCQGLDDHHLAGIEKLFHLKYLRLCSGSITKLPNKIGELQYLQTLDVRGTAVEKLPMTITKLQQLAHLYVDSCVIFPDGIIGKMLSLEELTQYGLQYYEQGKSLQEFSKLTRLRSLEIRWDFDLLDGLEGVIQAEGIYSYVGTLLSSRDIHSLYILNNSQGFYPLSLDSWHPAVPCSLQKFCMKGCPIYKVPNWMGSIGNLAVLKLFIICLRPEDLEILGAIPTLLLLKLRTFGGVNRIISIDDSYRFRSLKYFSLCIYGCGTSLKFRAGSMPKLEHVKLDLPTHDVECLNYDDHIGIQHLSALNKVEILLRGHQLYKYSPPDAKADGPTNSAIMEIEDAVEELPNHPTLTLEIEDNEANDDEDCERFECNLKEMNLKYGGVLTEWLKIWKIEEEHTDQQEGLRETKETSWEVLNEWLKMWPTEEELTEQGTGGETEQEDKTTTEETEQQEDPSKSNAWLLALFFLVALIVPLFSWLYGVYLVAKL